MPDTVRYFFGYCIQVIPMIMISYLPFWNNFSNKRKLYVSIYYLGMLFLLSAVPTIAFRLGEAFAPEMGQIDIISKISLVTALTVFICILVDYRYVASGLLYFKAYLLLTTFLYNVFVTLTSSLIQKYIAPLVNTNYYSYERLYSLLVCTLLSAPAMLYFSHFASSYRLNFGRRTISILYFVLPSILLVGTMIFLGNNIYVTHDSPWILASVILMFTSIFSYFAMLLFNMKMNNQKIDNEIQLNLTKEQTKLLEQEIEKHYRFRHEVKKYLDTIQDLLPKDSVLQRDFLANMQQVEKNNGGKIVTANGILNAILVRRINIMSENNIINSLDIKLPSTISDKHLMNIASLISNVLDNAIEACQRKDSDSQNQAEIKLKMEIKKNHLCIHCVNSKYEDIVKGEKGRLISSKGVDPNHGHGMNIMLHILNSVGGDMKLDYDEHSFSLVIIYPMT